MSRSCPQSTAVSCRVNSFWIAFEGFSLVLVATIVGAVLTFAAVKAKAESNADINARQDTQLREVTVLLRQIHSNQMVIMHHLNIRPPGGDGSLGPALSEDAP